LSTRLPLQSWPSLRREATGRKQAPRAVAVLADPVFDGDDPRVKSKARTTNQGATKRQTGETAPLFAQHLTRSVADIGLLHLPRLHSLGERSRCHHGIDACRAGTGGRRLWGQPLHRHQPRSGAISDRAFCYSWAIGQPATRAFGLVLSLVDQQGKPQNGFLDCRIFTI